MKNIKFILNKLISVFTGKTNMELEIMEQSDIISNLIKKYIKSDSKLNILIPDNIKNIAIIGSGSSYHCAAIAANFFRNNACYAQAYYSSEFYLSENISVNSETLYIFISQSGETSDTNLALKKISNKTDKTLALTNTKNSSLYNLAKYKMLIYAGEEKAIASTKAVCAQLFCLLLIALKIMQKQEKPINNFLFELKKVPESIKNSFNFNEKINKYAAILKNYDNAAILASGMFYPLAKEGALKIKETSYINTTAYPTGEFLHGHIAILNKTCAVIILINNNNVEFTKNVLCKIRDEYHSDLLIISAIELDNISLDTLISTKTKYDIDFLFVSLLIFQLLALKTSNLLNRNIDNPNGLTKIVK